VVRKLLPKWKRGALMVTAPAAPSEAERLVALAKNRGLSELWITATPDPSDGAALRAVVAAGRKGGVLVWAVVSLLRGCGVGGVERNFLGETGDAFAGRSIATVRSRPDLRENSEWVDETTAVLAGCVGWYCPAPAQASELAARLETVAAVPGLAGIVLR